MVKAKMNHDVRWRSHIPDTHPIYIRHCYNQAIFKGLVTWDCMVCSRVKLGRVPMNCGKCGAVIFKTEEDCEAFHALSRLVKYDATIQDFFIDHPIKRP